jgi:hypothetical protein
MRMRTWMVAAAGLAFVGCQTLTEQLPGEPSSASPNVPSNLVVVPVQVPIPSPAAPQPTPAPRDPAPNPNPNPNPQPVPTDPKENPGNNGSAVAKVGAKVFFVECNGSQVPNSEFASEAPVGCRVHLDATPKDSSGNVTNPKGVPNWTYDNENLIKTGNKSGDYTPVLTVLKSGDLSLYCVIDGVKSNTVNIHFTN